VFALVVLALVIGLAIGLVRGGTLNDLRGIVVPRRWALAGAALLIIFSRLVPAVGGLCWLAAAVVFALFAAANARIPGSGLVLAGIALNAIVVLTNGGRMPVSLHAADRAGISAHDVASARGFTPGDADTTLRPLTEVIPVALPGIPVVVGVGDILIAAGIGLFGAVAPPRAHRNLRDRRAARDRARAGAARRGAGRPPRPATGEDAAPADGLVETGPLLTAPDDPDDPGLGAARPDEPPPYHQKPWQPAPSQPSPAVPTRHEPAPEPTRPRGEPRSDVPRSRHRSGSRRGRDPLQASRPPSSPAPGPDARDTRDGDDGEDD